MYRHEQLFIRYTDKNQRKMLTVTLIGLRYGSETFYKIKDIYNGIFSRKYYRRIKSLKYFMKLVWFILLDSKLFDFICIFSL